MGLLETIGPRGLSRCLGWHCLTWSEQFGIIFTIVVVAIVLLVVYMYYLGLARLSYKERTTIRLPGGRRIKRQPNPNTAIASLPVAHQWPPGYPAQVAYYPTVFGLGSPEGPRAQPYAPPWISTWTQPAIVYVTASAQPAPGTFNIQATEPIHAGGTEARGTQPQLRGPWPAPAAGSFGRPREPTWYQRLGRVFRMPVGTASTVASSTAPGTPRRMTVDEGEARATECSPPQRADQHNAPTRSTAPAVDAAQDDDASSVQTNVATVHSDDFVMTDPAPSMMPGRGAVLQ